VQPPGLPMILRVTFRHSVSEYNAEIHKNEQGARVAKDKIAQQPFIICRDHFIVYPPYYYNDKEGNT
jgi:hypothetical protein